MSWVSGLISGAANLIGGGISAITGKHSRDNEYERQKEFAQSGLRWRVEDAKAAGIHPIFAVGANTPTYSPQAAVGTDFGLSQAGQDIGRAIEAGQTRRERQEMASVQKAYYEAQVANVQAQTEQHRAQTEAIKQGIINDALYNNVDFISQSALASQDKIRSQGGVPPKPETRSSLGSVRSDDFIEEVTFVRNPKGQLWSLRNTQDFHDMNEDVPVAELVPWLNGITWDMRAKLTREPIMVKGKWYAFNDNEGYVPIDIKTYKPYWKKWFTENRSHELNRMHNPKTGSRGMRAFFGG